MPTIVKELELESRKKRLIISWISIFSIALCFIISISTLVHADGFSDYFEELFGPNAVLSIFKEPIGSLMSGEMITSGLDVFYNSDVMTTIMSSISGQTQTFMTSLTTVLKTIGVLLCLFHSITKMLEEMQRGEMTMESYLRIIIAFVIPLVIIIEYDYFLDAFLKIGLWLHQITDIRNTETINSITNSYQDNSITGLTSPFSAMGLLSLMTGHTMELINQYLTALLKSLLILLLALTVNAIVLFTILTGIMSNYIEIMLRHIFMPIALAHITHEGVRSPGIRYIKKYLGCFLKIATIILATDAVFFIYNQLSNVPQVTTFEQWLFFIMIMPVTKQALKMTNEIITDAMGD